ncbi:MAG TPA: alpha-2-macroglobulin [Lysobacter sp.]
MQQNSPPAGPAASEDAAAAASLSSWQQVFGQWSWQPPPWLLRTVERIAAHWRQFLGGVVAIVLVAAFGQWWSHRPKPVVPDARQVSVDAPNLTDYGKTPPVIDKLRLTFSASAAPMADIGKAPKGVRMQPELAGSWLWKDDRTLEFTPAGDWPVGQDYTLRLDREATVAPKVPLDEDEFEFATAPFAATLRHSEFYQDPVDPAMKKAVFEFGFSHPVDAAQFERRIALQFIDGGGVAQPTPTRTIAYDERRLKAWVHTQPLQLPENGGVVKLSVARGVTSVLGGKGSDEVIEGQVSLPSLYSVAVDSVEATLVDNERFEPEQVLVFGFNNAMKDADVARATHAWLLPAKNPRIAADKQPALYAWSQDEVDEALLKQSKIMPLTALPSEREYIETHSFRYSAPPGRSVYVRVDKGLKAFGGFILGKPHAAVERVPEYPQLLRFVGEGALLSLRGERRISIVSRNVDAARLEIARVLPGQLHHLAFNNEGSYAQPYLSNVEADSLVDRAEKRLKLPMENPAKAHYEGVDLGDFLAPSRRGVFMLSLRTLSEGDAQRSSQQTLADGAGEEQDSRLVVLTDLGIIVKKALDGSRDVFVQSLATGAPVAGARVKAIARNGETLAEAESDAEGRAHLPALDDFKREKQATMLTISKDDDLSFLPIGDRYSEDSRVLDYSRFDIGGEPNDLEAGALSAYLFTDRGLYRPGDTVHIGMIVRPADWKQPLAGLPLEAVITDPRGTVARKQRIALGASGFESLDYTAQDSAPSGTWQVTLSLIGKGDARTPIGQTSLQVREFAPDTLRVRAQLSRESTLGWIRPDALKAIVTAENLFGTPAQQRKVEATLVLRPAFPAFAQYPDYRFYDPQRAKEGIDEDLSDGVTGADGRAEFAIDLKKYERATYQLQFLARAFEPGSGRNVAAQSSMLVSDHAYLVGIKAADDLQYVSRGAKRAVQLLAIGPDGKPRAVKDLQAVVVERRYVSVLTKQDSGLYRYVSHERRYDRHTQALAPRAGALAYALPTDRPGDYELQIRTADGTVLNQVAYSVAGAGNLTRSLDRNAELALTLSKPRYKPGETIEISIRAPYKGSGLITLERDRVYAQTWFKADTTASVQRITVPADFEGNGYVNVQFLRDPSSDEIFMSPLSYGVAAFAVDRAARQQPLKISLPKVSKPGARIPVDITTAGKARVVVFAVDEGILQVARYRVGDPLDHFFRKKMLQVDTAQILDLLLPEFSRLKAMAAPGGDGEGGLAKHLNPFKRKSEKPAVWWSGLFDVDGSKRVSFTLPDHFNGQVRVVAVAVTPQRVGLAETQALVRGDFVLTPTLPTHVAPGDEFELPVGIANTIEGATAPASVTATLTLPRTLTLVGPAPAALTLAPGREATQRFRLRAGAVPGAAPIVIKVQAGKHTVQRRIELSVRPASVARQDLRVGRADRRIVIDKLRVMYDQRATRQLSAAPSPLVAMDGLSAYLDGYPHLCSEQLLSQAIPALVFASHPEFGTVSAPAGASPAQRDLIDVLRSRQNSEGGIGTWSATPDADPFVSGYAALYLLEARERGVAVPTDLLQSLNPYLEALAADRSRHDLAYLRARAQAVYLLVRQGRTASNLLSAVHEQLQRDQPKAWQGDTAGILIAASYKLLQQDRPAHELAGKAFKLAAGATPAPETWQYAYYSDPGIDHAWRVYLLNRHFPALAKQLKPAARERLLDPLRYDRYNTLSSALTLLALEADASARGVQALPTLQAAGKNGKPRQIGGANGLIRRGGFLGSDLRLWVTPADRSPAWYLLNQSGFDRAPPRAVQDQGLEVLRDYLGDDGKPVTTLKLGQEITVRVRVRALGASVRGDVAIIDLLPGGFEPVLQYPAAGVHAAAASDEGEDEYEADGNASESDTPAVPLLALPGSSFLPQHVEQREDRIVLYGSAVTQVTEFRYRIRANNVGVFVVPPIHAESMYERSIHAQGGPAGTLQVVATKP